MNPGYFNQLQASFNLFLNHELAYYGDAYTNTSGLLYPTSDPNFSQFSIYGAPFRQFVSDSSVVNAVIPSGVYNGDDFVSSLWDSANINWNDFTQIWNAISGNVAVDYERGRIISPVLLNNPTLAYALKTFNIYSTTLDEADLLIDRAFQIQPQIYQATGALNYNQEPIPAIYIKLNYGENVPFAFGGLDQSNTTINCIVLADSPYKLDACCTLLNDTARKYFPLFPIADLPFNVFGNMKNGLPYNYNELVKGQNPSNFIEVKRVRTSKFTENVNKQINRSVWCALVDFELAGQRNPRQYY